MTLSVFLFSTADVLFRFHTSEISIFAGRNPRKVPELVFEYQELSAFGIYC